MTVTRRTPRDRWACPTVDALERAIFADPTDTLLPGMLADALRDLGASELAASRRMWRTLRAAVAARQVADAEQLLGANSADAEYVHSRIFDAVGLVARLGPVVVVAGAGRPRVTGRREHWIDINKPAVRYYLPPTVVAPADTVHVPDTRRAEVGALWVLREAEMHVFRNATWRGVIYRPGRYLPGGVK